MTGDYVALLDTINKANLSASGLMGLMFLFLFRMLPIIALIPFFGGKILPHPVKMMFGLALFAIALPKLIVVTKTPILFNGFLIVLCMKEMLIGLAIGLLMDLPFWAAEIAGIITDHQRGGASLMINDPTVQNQSSPLGVMYNYVLIYLFYVFNGPFIFIDVIFTSYDIVPPDQLLSSLFFTDKSPLWDQIISLLNDTMVLGIRLASPALMAILMTDMFLGIINRMAPQVMITFLGMPLKSLLGLAVICIGWKLLTKEMVDQAIARVEQIRLILIDFKIGI
jgi:type III secretion protein T